MRSVVYSLSISLDGYIKDGDGRFDWSVPSDETSLLATDEVRGVDVHLLGRNLYESMLYWETAEQEVDLSPNELEFTRIWNALPKVVFSSTLRKVVGNARLAAGSLTEEIEALRSEGDGDIAIGGADLAADAADLGLIDEYRIRIYPVLVGGGTPYFAHHGQHRDLRLVESRVLDGAIAYLRYRVVRPDEG